MANGLDAAESFQLLFGPLTVRTRGLQVSINKLDSLE